MNLFISFVIYGCQNNNTIDYKFHNQRFDFNDKISFINSFSEFLESQENQKSIVSFNLIELKDNCETDFQQIIKTNQEENFIESNIEETWCFIDYMNNNQENNERIYFLLSQSLLRKINDLNRY
jgi:hypothetical protein